MVWQALSLLSLLSLLAFVGTGLTLHTLPRGSGTTVTRSTAQSSGVHLSWVFCLMMLGEVAAVKIATPGVITDRYLIPIVPFVIAVTLHRASESGLLVHPFRPVAIASLAIMALLGTAVVDAAATYDGAKWQFATSVQRSGFAPESIDGGYEWFGYHQTGEIVDFRLNAPARNWWNRLFESRNLCVETRYGTSAPKVGTGAHEGRIIGRWMAHTLFGVKVNLVAVRTTNRCLVTTGRVAR